MLKLFLAMLSRNACGYWLLYALLVPSISIGQYTSEQAEVYLQQLHESPFENTDSALSLTNSLINFFGKKKMPCAQVKALTQKGMYLTTKQDYKSALEHILEAQRKLDKTSCDVDVQCQIDLALISLYIKLGDLNKARILSHKAIKRCSGNNVDKATMVILYLKLGQSSNEIESSIPYLDTAYNLAKDGGYLPFEQRALIDIGTTYAINGMVDKASDYLKLALKVARERNDIINLGLLYNNLAGLTDDHERIVNYMDSALYYARLHQNLKNEQTYTENMAYAMYNASRYKEAYLTLWQSVELKDSLIELNKYEAIAELEKKYEAEKKSNEIQALKLKNLNTEVEKLKYKRNQNSLLIGTLILLVVMGVLAFNFITIRKNRNLLAQKNTELSHERKRSDDLLLNILPGEIAQELKQTGMAKAKQFEVASILFTDFIEFTQTTETLSTEALIEELNYCFMGFDNILEKYGLEKIKTIGDSYMAAGGLPVPFAAATKNTVMAAIEMQSFISERRAAQMKVGKPSFEMRAGISTGPVVAGIVGVKKFQYDIWGDTVNTASRMETMGEANKVNISQSTYDLLKREPELVFENRGYVAAKGKGEIAMYFVALA